MVIIILLITIIYNCVSALYWKYRVRVNNSNTGYEEKMIKGYLKKCRIPLIIITCNLALILVFTYPVSYSKICPAKTVTIEVKERSPLQPSKRVVIDKLPTFDNIFSDFSYKRSLLHSFSMHSWYGDTLKLYFMDEDGHDLLILYVIVSEDNNTVLILDSTVGVVYKVKGYGSALVNTELRKLFDS